MEKKYCAAMWHGLHINPRGDIKTCCAGDPNMFGNLATHTVEEVLNSTQMKELRANAKDGVLDPQYCYNCIQQEKTGRSERSWHNDVNEHFNIDQVTDEYEYPTIVDTRWNTTCNQSCNYCDASASSSWAKILGHPYKAETRKHTQGVFDLVKKHEDSLKEVALVGGEPLLLKENIALLDSIVGSPAKVVIITNLNVNLDDNQVFKKLSDRHEVGWSLSFDNIGSEYEYVRYGGSWDLHEKNIDTVVNLMQDPTKCHDGGIHAVYNVYNCTRLVKFKEWADSKGLSIIWQRLYKPDSLDVAKQCKAVRDLAIEEIDEMTSRFSLSDHEKQFFSLAKEELLNSTATSKEVLSFTHKVETEFHPEATKTFKELWPEIYDALTK